MNVCVFSFNGKTYSRKNRTLVLLHFRKEPLLLSACREIHQFWSSMSPPCKCSLMLGSVLLNAFSIKAGFKCDFYGVDKNSHGIWMMHLVVDEFVAEISCICIFILRETAMSNSANTTELNFFKRGHNFPCGLNMLFHFECHYISDENKPFAFLQPFWSADRILWCCMS